MHRSTSVRCCTVIELDSESESNKEQKLQKTYEYKDKNAHATTHTLLAHPHRLNL